MADDPMGSFKRWILLYAERKTIATGVLAITFVAVYGLMAAGVVGVARIGPIRTLFGSIITGVFTVLSIVLSINQVVLSRIFGSLGDYTDRMSASLEFHRDVEEQIEADVTPTDPDAFLRTLMQGLADRARQLDQMVDEEPVTGYAADIESYAEDVQEELSGEGDRTFEVLATILNDNYSGNIQRARGLQAKHGDDLSEEARSALDDIATILQEVGIVRQYFKTVYVQEELASLSRSLLYLGFPALVIAALVILLYARAGGPPLWFDGLELVVSAALTATFAPIAIVLAVLLRVATIARLTTALGPFTPKK